MEIRRVQHLVHAKSKKRLGEKGVETYIGDDGNNGRRDEIAPQRHQPDDDQIEKSNRRRVDVVSKANERQERERNAAKQKLRT